MHKLIIIIASALVLAGCGAASQASDDASQISSKESPPSGDVAQIKIADIDFNDMDKIKEIARKLGRDGSPFMSYVVSRAEAKATLSEPEIARPDGSPPATVAEAVELAKAVREKRAAARNN